MVRIIRFQAANFQFSTLSAIFINVTKAKEKGLKY